MQSHVTEIQSFPIAGDGFTISRGTRKEMDVVYVKLTRSGISGEGECAPLKRYNHTPESIKAEIDNWLSEDHSWTRNKLIDTLPAGPARFALDTAMWQLEAAEKNTSFAQLTAITPSSIPTAYTLSAAAPEVMAANATAHKNFRWLKTKLMGDGLDAERLNAIHKAAPDTELIVDANESLTPETLRALLPAFIANNVVLIEQPLPADNDEALRSINFPIPFAADESCHDINDLEKLVGKYQVVNLKLDKTGGLTHAFDMKQRATELGFKIMVGCMVSTSLSILPAFFLSQDIDYIDLDGALLLTHDRNNASLNYQDASIKLVD